MEWKSRNIRALADIICGNESPYFEYRSSFYLTRFFEECDLDFAHDGSTRGKWVGDRLQEVLALPQPGANKPPTAFAKIIKNVLDKREAQEGDKDREKALETLNTVIRREGWEAFYDQAGVARLRHLATQTIAESENPHRPLSPKEQERREQLTTYLDSCTEDQLIDELLLPLFRQLGFQRLTSAGHRDKALEYGKDVWMKFMLPTQHSIYFGIQVKKGKLDSSGVSKAGSSNVAEILNQVQMMLGHEIFDPETNRRSLVDHAFIIAGGVITKAARNWLGERLDASKRSQILFMDREDILNLYVVNNLPLPKSALTKSDSESDFDDEIPF